MRKRRKEKVTEGGREARKELGGNKGKNKRGSDGKEYRRG